MAILPLQVARVSNLLSTGIAQQQITQTEQQLLETQNELTTGKRINVPSDDPGAASIVMQLQKTLDQRGSYSTNLQSGQSQLSEVDSNLSDLNDLLTQAQTIASSDVGSDITAAQRQGDAAIIDSLYNQAIAIGNKQFEGSYLFGGDKATQPPFVSSAGGVKFAGSTTVLQNTYDDGTTRPFQVSGADVFGGPVGVAGSVDLTPSLTATTRLIDLGGTSGNGIHLGTIQLSDGTSKKTVDLSSADTIGDVIKDINGAGLSGITASISPSGLGLQITGGGGANIAVQDPQGGSTASDLGIANAAGAGATLSGSSVQPRLTSLTTLASLRGGLGIDQAAGLKITAGTQTKVISFAGAKTIEDLLNAVNNSGTNVQAQINAAGTGIDILNTVQGTQLTIAENGGTTAADLGVRSFGPATPLDQLNGGAGVNTVAGADFQITRSDGTSFTVDVDGAKTVQDVIDKINTAAGGAGVTASFATSGNGIILTDSAGGGGKLAVAALNASRAAADLGLSGPAVGNTITGTDVNPMQATGIFADLAQLRDSLKAGNQNGITAAAGGLKTDADRVTSVRGQAGAQVQEFQARQDQLDQENLATKSLMSSLADTDFTTAVTKFQTLQTALQATLQTTAKVLNLSLLDFLQ